MPTIYMTNVKIPVTQEHINLGTPNSSGDCPIAHAIRESFPGRPVQVETQEIYTEDRYGTDIVIQLPLDAQEFIHRFDEDGARADNATFHWRVKPFSLWLQVPEEFLPSPRSGASEVFFS